MFRLPDYFTEKSVHGGFIDNAPHPSAARKSEGDLSGDTIRRRAERRANQDRAFKNETVIFNARQAAIEIIDDAKAEAGPNGDGLTKKIAVQLAALRGEALSTLDHGGHDDVEQRILADHERHISNAAAEEVRRNQDWTRQSLSRMHEQLLSDIVAEPHRKHEIIDEGVRLVSSNSLPEWEKAVRSEAWERQANIVLAAAVPKRQSSGGSSGTIDRRSDTPEEREAEKIRAIMKEFDEKARTDLLNPLNTRMFPITGPGPNAVRHLQENPQSVADFVDYYGVEWLPQEFVHSPTEERQNALRDLREVMDGKDHKNPYPEIERKQRRISTISKNLGPGRLKSAFNSAVVTGADGIAEIPKTLANADFIYIQDHLLPYVRERARGGSPKPKITGAIHEEDWIRIWGSPKEELWAWIVELEKTSLEDLTAYKLGQGLSDGARKYFAVNPMYDDEFQQQLGRVVGAMVAYSLVAATTRGVGLGAGMGAGMVGAANQGQATFREALSKGKSFAEAYEAAKYGQLIGLTEALPVLRFIDRFDRGRGGRARDLIAEAYKGGTENALQDAFQTLAADLVASDLVGYDPERELFTGMGDAAGMSFSLGALTNTLAALAGRKVHKFKNDLEGQVVPVPRKITADPDFLEKSDAKAELRRLKDNFDRKLPAKSAEEYLSSSWHNLSADEKVFLRKRISNFSGQAGESIVGDLLLVVNKLLDRSPIHKLPTDFSTESRKFDWMASSPIDNNARLFSRDSEKAKFSPRGVEVKVASSRLTKDQAKADEYLVGQKRVDGVEYFRVPASQIKTEHISEAVIEMLNREPKKGKPGNLPRKKVIELAKSLRRQADKEELSLTAGQLMLITLGAILLDAIPESDAE